MLLDLNKKMKGINGVEVKDDSQELCKIVAQLIAFSTNELTDPIKYMNIADKLYNEGKIEIDDSDIHSIENFIKNSQNLTLLCKSQILKEISDTRLKV